MTFNDRLIAILEAAAESACEALNAVDPRRNPDAACFIEHATDGIDNALRLLRAEAEEINRDLEKQAASQ